MTAAESQVRTIPIAAITVLNPRSRNKRIFQENAAALRAAGLDPDRAPLTIDELDAYADVLTVKSADGHIVRSGFLPMEPNWYVNYNCYSFGGNFFDVKTQKFTLTSPQTFKAYEWIESYAKMGERLGVAAR